MKTFWYTEHPGIGIFVRAGKMYFDEYGKYPTSMDELPKYLNKMGYHVTPTIDYDAVVAGKKIGQRLGITVEDDVATLLTLRFG